MGTTQTAIRGSNPELGMVLVIEGYPYLITDGLASEAVTAWAATIWSQALPGLVVNGSFEQSLEPWSNELSIPRLTFGVIPDASDQFAVDFFKSKPSVRTGLTVGFDNGDAGAGAFGVTVQDEGNFVDDEVFYIGNEAFLGGTHAANTLNIVANGAGYYAPFGTDTGSANRFPGPHSTAPLANVGNFQVNAQVNVSNAPASWLGKKVGLYVHRINGGVWDLQAQAEVWFAGIIDSVSESSQGVTVIQCSGIQKSLIDTIVMSDQWSGQIREGYTFEAGDWISASYAQNGVGYASAKLTAVVSSPGADQFLEGVYTAAEFSALVTAHLNEDATVGRGSTVSVRWTAGVFASSSGPRWRLRVEETGIVDGQIWFNASNVSILAFLGFTGLNASETGAATKISPVISDNSVTTLSSESAPFRFPPIGVSTDGQRDINLLEIVDTDGTFADHTSKLPPSALEHVGSGEVWSFYTVGDGVLFLGRRDSNTQISGIRTDLGITALANRSEAAIKGIRLGEGGSLRVKQCLFLSGTFCSIIGQLFASVDGNGVNHATLDTLPFGAGIPWGLLGQNFIDSLDALEQSGSEDSVALLVEKPTRLWDLVKSDFALRMAGIVWKDNGLQVAQFSVPNASTADHTLDETNKTDSKRTRISQTSSYLAHSVKIEFNRSPLDGKYTDFYIARDEQAYQSAGNSGVTKTISARNSYAASTNSGASVEALADVLTSRFLPVLSRPLKTWTRSISHRHFHIAPGDTVAITDDWVRSPTTGIRGVSARPATVIAVRHSFGISSDQGYFGEVDLLYTEEDRTFPLSPSAEHADVTVGAYTNGGDAATGLLFHQHKFSDATATTDVGSFAAGDAVRITPLDPTTPTSSGSFTDVIASTEIAAETSASIDYDEVVLTTGFNAGGNPAFDGTLTYMIEYDLYNQTQASQKLYAFQADDGDGKIQDLIDSNLQGDTTKLGSAAADLTLLPSRYASEQYGDGAPFSAAFVRDQIRMANNLLNYKTAPHMPFLTDSYTGPPVATIVGGAYQVQWTFPFYVGPGRWPAPLSRKIICGPVFTSGGGTIGCRIISSANPPKDDDFESATYFGPKQTVSWTTSGTKTHGAAQSLTVVRAENIPEFTWITVEAQDGSIFLGLHELRLGPLQ